AQPRRRRGSWRHGPSRWRRLRPRPWPARRSAGAARARVRGRGGTRGGKTWRGPDGSIRLRDNSFTFVTHLADDGREPVDGPEGGLDVRPDRLPVLLLELPAGDVAPAGAVSLPAAEERPVRFEQP